MPSRSLSTSPGQPWRFGSALATPIWFGQGVLGVGDAVAIVVRGAAVARRIGVRAALEAGTRVERVGDLVVVAVRRRAAVALRIVVLHALHLGARVDAVAHAVAVVVLVGAIALGDRRPADHPEHARGGSAGAVGQAGAARRAEREAAEHPQLGAGEQLERGARGRDDLDATRGQGWVVAQKVRPEQLGLDLEYVVEEGAPDARAEGQRVRVLGSARPSSRTDAV
jgi:hypothetical protein